ncbi:S-adenosylmethionine decarboxylase [Candidatus Adlerbacteria bacterium RIFCSPLOWO2_01_FULL_51_16]|uniref:S-adenosylmethionine decarboxylase n=1 Tax=Candidatus Adlerbacteria bacterium RIFCSPLOWO2_01_FULL_51_16 TaxID=1797243 RepID=A0A1F4XF50_9BACT|nr:MAG: S-adenosylmethionine decarboxylase [Candidatus Adlerbacteria bacterium RIFCSPLOWO2_01_FULL_51_16]
METQSALPKIKSAALDALEGGDAAIRSEYEKSGAWGMLTSIDIHGCNPETIRSADEIKRFVVELCDLIKMKRFGECTVVNFGEDEKVAGFSMVQLIETSCISAHFANQTNTTYLDIFSCKCYSPVEAAEFAKEFFGGSDYTMTYTLRK